MVVPPKHPKMVIFSRKTHGCWVPLFLETPISSSWFVGSPVWRDPRTAVPDQETTETTNWIRTRWIRKVDTYDAEKTPLDVIIMLSFFNKYTLRTKHDGFKKISLVWNMIKYDTFWCVSCTHCTHEFVLLAFAVTFRGTNRSNLILHDMQNSSCPASHNHRLSGLE